MLKKTISAKIELANDYSVNLSYSDGSTTISLAFNDYSYRRESLDITTKITVDQLYELQQAVEAILREYHDDR